MIDITLGGTSLKQAIPGLRILSVTGREIMTWDVTDKEIEGVNGAHYLRSGYGSRDIVVSFALCAPTKEAYRMRMNKLNHILAERQVKLVFSDENDKYFISSSASASQKDITFHCSDPLKYSIVEKPVTFTNGTATITNNGTVPVPIRYEITTSSHDNGYIGIASEYGAMEFGKREEADGESYVENERLLQFTDLTNAADDTSGTDCLHPSDSVKGTMATHTYKFPSGYNGGTYLGFGTAGTIGSGLCNGGARTVTLKADSNGQKGAKNFYSYMHLAQWAGAMGQTGQLSVCYLTSDNKVIAGLTWDKNDKSGNTGSYQIAGPNGTIRTWNYETHHLQDRNPFTDSWGHCDLRKEGSKLTFYYRGSYFTYDIPEAADMVCTKVQVTCKQYGSRGGSQMIDTLGFNQLELYKIGVNKWRDVPNRYRVGTTVTIDGNTGEFLVSGMPKPEDEIVGTQWFKAHPGDTEIKLCVSSFCSPAPTAKAYIREAWV